MRILLIGLRPVDNSHNTLALGYLKAYADKFLAGNADIRIFDVAFGGIHRLPLLKPSDALRSVFGMHRAPLLKLIDSFRPDLIGFSCFFWNIEEIASLCALIRRKSRATIVLGGPEMKGDAAKALKLTGADVAVIGEGEATFLELLERFRSNASLSGLAGALVRTKSGFVRGPEREFIANLDDIPSPYLAGIYDEVPCKTFVLETMRGCRGDCAFCAWSNKKSKLRFFSLDRIRQELDWLKKHAYKADVEVVDVIDSDSFDNKSRALALLKYFRKMSEESKCRCWFQTRLTNLDTTLMRAANSPLLVIGGGVDTINPKALSLANRPDATKTIEKRIIQFRGSAPRASLIIQMLYPMPGDTFSDLCDMLDWAWRQDVTGIVFSRIVILSGSRYEADAKELGIKYQGRSPSIVISTAQCTARQIRLVTRLLFFIYICRTIPLISDKFKAMAQNIFGNSHTRAMRDLYVFLPAKGRKIMETALADWLERIQRSGNFSLQTNNAPNCLSVKDKQQLANTMGQAMVLYLKSKEGSSASGISRRIGADGKTARKCGG